MLRIDDKSGLSLMELLIALALTGIIVTCLYPIWGSLNAYNITKSKQDLLTNARYAMERMCMFVQETGKISIEGSELKVTERVLDTYDNVTHTYRADGDGLPDSDHDGNGVIDDGNGDVEEEVRFRLVGTSLLERLPNYATDNQNDFAAERVLSNYVTLFKCTKLGSNVVEIQLNLSDGKNAVNLKTRVKARLIPD